MDKNSTTIDRHTPTIPRSIWCGMTPTIEAILTSIKNRLILPFSNLGNIKSAMKVKSDDYPRVITDEMLAEAEHISNTCCGILTPELFGYLNSRGVSASEILTNRICSTKMLVERLPTHIVENLTLCLPEKLLEFTSNREIDGISLPYWYDGKFCGFVTRILNHLMVKYAISIPNRLCYGVDFSQPEVWIVEGAFDALALKRLGYNTFGMGDSQPNVFKMWTASKFQHINLLFDDDLAGWLGVQRAWVILRHMLEVSEQRISIWALHNGVDPEVACRAGSVSHIKVTFAEAQQRYIDWLKWEQENGN